MLVFYYIILMSLATYQVSISFLLEDFKTNLFKLKKLDNYKAYVNTDNIGIK